MRWPTVRHGATAAAAGCVLLAAFLAALEVTVGLGVEGWTVGIGCAVATGGIVARTARHEGHVLTPADQVTLARLVLACAVAALVADAVGQPPQTGVLVSLTATALVLDNVDGRVARRSGGSAFGARFDAEVDAFLMLILSVHVAPLVGWWVLLIGLARYAFAVSGWVVPWLRMALPARPWRKVAAAVAAVALVVAAANVLPVPLARAAMLVALALIAESFGRDVVWTWRRRNAPSSGGALEVPVAGGAALRVLPVTRHDSSPS
jgi:hypothetical protein